MCTLPLLVHLWRGGCTVSLADTVFAEHMQLTGYRCMMEASRCKYASVEKSRAVLHAKLPGPLPKCPARGHLGNLAAGSTFVNLDFHALFTGHSQKARLWSRAAHSQDLQWDDPGFFGDLRRRDKEPAAGPGPLLFCPSLWPLPCLCPCEDARELVLLRVSRLPADRRGLRLICTPPPQAVSAEHLMIGQDCYR